MKQHVLVALGLAGFLTVAACHKTAPVALRPAPPVPVATATPATTQSSGVSTAKNTRSQGMDARGSSGMTPQERMTLNTRLARLEDALFDFDKATIRTDTATALKGDVDVIRGILANYPRQKLVIEGNSDQRGSEEYNLALGDRRARATEEFLTTMGVPAVQLTVISFGKERPVCTESTDACWQKNRHAHITAAP